MRKPLIVLQTDFSNTWSAVATMKGVIKCVDPELEIFDLTHDIKKFDPFEASLSLATTEPYWPKGTIFVSVVDPTVGSKRKASAALLNDGNIVISPDNGSFTHLKKTVGIREIREIYKEIRFPAKEEVSVFHGRDIFAYAAALLASGQKSFEEIGEAYDPSDAIESELANMKPELKEREVRGVIFTGLAHYGGVEINITNEEFHNCGFQEGEMLEVMICEKGREVFHRPVRFDHNFSCVELSEPILYCGSSRYLSLDCNQDSFMERYQIGFGKDWTIAVRG